jgi:hypothetical protein
MTSPREAASPDGPGGVLPHDELYQLLSCQRRRYVLYYLQQEGGTGSLTDIARQVTAWETDTSSEEITSSSQYKSVRVSLYQYHLPKMADGGVLEYDRDRGLVTVTATMRDLEPFLTSGEDTRSLLPGYPYTAVALVGTLVAALSLGGYVPLDACFLSSYTMLAALVGLVVLSLVVSTGYSR